ncbi:MAG: hypothetical protein KC501_31200 [Myxococcales bacterium]|nr:hypothetical protein [Myxococcales bacterium]
MLRIPISLTLAVLLSGCLGADQPPPAPGQRAKGRKGDPELVHHWQMPADKSPLQSADLGSEPPALADALMQGGAAPSITHRIALACATQSALAGTESVALRLGVAEGGTLESLEGDPAGKAASCLADALRAELAESSDLPAGAALLVLQFHGSEAR